MALTKGTSAYDDILQALKPLQSGVVVSIDPSVGSASSQPAFAVYREGQLVDSGVIEIHWTKPLWERLNLLAFKVRQIYLKYKPDVLVYEAISDVPFKGYSGRGHASLQKALGAILSVAGPKQYVGLLAHSWKRLARSSYEKSDLNDAIEIGWVAISQAAVIGASSGKPRKKKGKKDGQS